MECKCTESAAWLVLLDEALSCCLPDSALPGTAWWLWGKSRTNMSLHMVVTMAVIGTDKMAGRSVAG